VETTYKVLYATLPGLGQQDYLAQFRAATTASQGQEGQDRTIEMTLRPLERPSEVAFTASQECDKLEIHNDFYKTIKYGCCTELNKVRFFDYDNKEIIEGSDKVITGYIPNNDAVFFFAFSDANIGPKTLGKITISYGSGQRYDINLLSDKPLPELTCPYSNPKLELLSSNKKDTEYDSFRDSYSLWSLEKIKSTIEINKVSIKVSFTCDKSMKPFVIPIINGLPFGKDQKVQSYNVR
jgi:hypothetical protein